MQTEITDQEFLSVIMELFSEKIPFNKIIGLRICSVNSDCVKTQFDMRDALVGNQNRGMLHGGVISSAIDATGGLAAFVSIQKSMRGKTLEAKLEKSSKMSTVDLRVDFLRPGIGKKFTVTASNLRTGNKVVVTRIEMHNDKNELIAVGTGSYLVG